MALKMPERMTKRVEVTSSLTTETGLNPTSNGQQSVTNESPLSTKTPSNPPSHEQRDVSNSITVGEVEELAGLLSVLMTLGDANNPVQIKDLSSSVPQKETGVQSTPVPDTKAAGDVGDVSSPTVRNGEVEELAKLLAVVLALGDVDKPVHIKNLGSAVHNEETEVKSTPIQEKDATVTADVKIASSWRNETCPSPPASDGQQFVTTKPSPTAKIPPNPPCKEQNLVTDKIIGGERREAGKLTDLMPHILTLREAHVHVASSVTAKTAAKYTSAEQHTVTTVPSVKVKDPANSPSHTENAVTMVPSKTVKAPAMSSCDEQRAVSERGQSGKRKRRRRRFTPSKRLKSASLTPVEIEIESLTKRFCALSV
ncbi:uncharacterized protein LOC134262163 [Saccostrea cucullata]|uniref:uncharacterized protein LOC134262163 n=1 Tax=Saccostrea cuccullata TaxID=36930 RepID=UPI002ED1C557